MATIFDDIWTGVTSLISTVAPTIATALGGPLAGTAVSAITGALGLDATTPAKEIVAAVQKADPETLLKLKQAEQDFQATLAKLDVDLERIAADDRASARDREKAVGSTAINILADIVIVGFFATVGYVLSGRVGLTGEQGVLVGTVVGYVSAKADQVVSYFFGSSHGSERKTAAMSAAMTKARG